MNFYSQKEYIDARVFMLLLKNVSIMKIIVLQIFLVVWKTLILKMFYHQEFFQQELVKIRNTACLRVSNIWKLFYLLRKKMRVYRLKMTILFPSSIHIRRKFIVKTVWNIIWDCYIFLFLFCWILIFRLVFFFKKKTKKMAFAYNCYKKYERKEFLTKFELDYAVDHICLNLNNPSFSYKYFYNMYSYTAKSYIVLRWKKKHRNPDQVVSVKFGKAICNDQLVNFFENEEHNHCSCSSVYYKI